MSLLNGKKCLITGASSGLGLELTKLFIREGAEVFMLCRNEAKCKDLIQDLTEAYPVSKIHYVLADFSSLESVKNFIEGFKKRNASLDILINNAAVLKPEISKTVNGFESMFQVNYLVPFFLTNALMNLLKQGNSPQIINIALPSKKLRIDFNDIQSLNKFRPMTNLFHTKLLLFLYSLELSKRLKYTDIKILTGIPGKRPFKTNLGREMPSYMKLLMRLISVETEKVAGNILYWVNNNDFKTGEIFSGITKVNPEPYWQDNGLRNELWEYTENLLYKHS